MELEEDVPVGRQRIYMADDANARMQKLLQANAEKIRELESFADAKSEENAVLIEQFHKNHKLLEGKVNEQLRKRRHIP